MYADSHLHLASFGEQTGQVLTRAREGGVTEFLAVAVTLDSSEEAVRTAREHEGVFGGVGLHPWWLQAPPDEATYGQLRRLAQENQKVVAVGECGLDYQPRYVESKARQLQTLRGLIALAKGLKLPLSLHCREAHQDLIQMLREEKASEVGGCIHGYTGEETDARRLIDLGFHIGAGRALLAPENEALREVFRRLPLASLMLETDSSYRAPGPPTSEPALTRAVAEKVAELKGVSLEEVARATTGNFHRVFRLRS